MKVFVWDGSSHYGGHELLSGWDYTVWPGLCWWRLLSSQFVVESKWIGNAYSSIWEPRGDNSRRDMHSRCHLRVNRAAYGTLHISSVFLFHPNIFSYILSYVVKIFPAIRSPRKSTGNLHTKINPIHIITIYRKTLPSTPSNLLHLGWWFEHPRYWRQQREQAYRYPYIRLPWKELPILWDQASKDESWLEEVLREWYDRIPLLANRFHLWWVENVS